ncbi:hypothetical protein [Magnetospira sp. QH-2]|uniref:hypothetical protein n=1 Tax=Magnetospira sp. (strain QH-2) TaxID=1288970 RepID=UPI0003E81853|nr:hypothetical protein [Magnetospira sp. QH-2]CCQ72456.1 Putative Replication initiation factor [Magnetospira sp. QH-2]
MPHPDFQLLLRGLDSLFVSYYLDTLVSEIDWDELAYLKEKTGRDRGEKFGELTLGSESFALKPFGKHPYTYVLGNKAFEIRLGERLSPSCHVQFRSEGLWMEGLDRLTSRFDTWVASIGSRFLKPEVVSRADWAFDYHLPVWDFARDDFVSRSRKDATWRENQKDQTHQFGKGEVVLRVYDKVAEIEAQSAKAWFFELWGRKDHVCRVEFQIRGERLKEGGIRTMADLREFQGDILRELATNHTSLRKPNGDSNRSRWPLHPLWSQLTDDIGTLPQTGLVKCIDQMAPVEWRLDRSGKMVHGYLKNIAALLYCRDGGTGAPDLDDVLAELPHVIAQHHSPVAWSDDVTQRIKEIELGQ